MLSSTVSSTTCFFFTANRAIIIPASYKIINGPAIKHWVMTSGGVSIAAATNVNNKAYFLFRLRRSGLTRPTLAKKKTTTGSSKTIPKAKRSLMAKEKYCLIEGRAWICSLANPKKNLKPKGKTIK